MSYVSNALHQVQNAAVHQVLFDNPQLQPGDAILVMGSKVFDLTQPAVQGQISALQLQLYTLLTDLEALGLVGSKKSYGHALTDTEWVELSLQRHPLYSY